MSSYVAIISVLCVATLMGVSETAIREETVHRYRRQLLYPNSTLFQVNIGFGTPTPIKTINVNWAMQANFQLPWNRSQIPVDLLWANSGYDGESRGKRELQSSYYENDAKLYHFYQYVEDALNNYGHNGTACVLKTLCQLGAEPLHTDHDDDLLHEITSYVLNPSNDIAKRPCAEAAPYVHAFEHGRNLRDCSRMFQCTTISLLDMFTKVFDSP
ncbi:uncharacterized protein LOC125234085 [Leguminivora glycinivorella]|uniref:uncharacterized protein LOC125234085 n=1 Tax=Leguminivora glycinivorella TaxID=1035111 RepID=UPI00200DFAEE|nr:uncharacterized protein LOC125234085 [Leguminivora glycinivorella]